MKKAPEFNCVDKIKESTMEKITKELGTASGRRSLGTTIIENEDKHDADIETVIDLHGLRDPIAVNHFYVEKMYNMMFLNRLRSRDR